MDTGSPKQQCCEFVSFRYSTRDTDKHEQKKTIRDKHHDKRKIKIKVKNKNREFNESLN